jgi:hypothetical protein
MTPQDQLSLTIIGAITKYNPSAKAKTTEASTSPGSNFLLPLVAIEMFSTFIS